MRPPGTAAALFLTLLAGPIAVAAAPDGDKPSGRWSLAPDGALSPEQELELERLRAIGYVSGSLPAPDHADVTLHDSGRASAGLNFYTSGHGPVAILMDMDGTVLHEWRKPFADVFGDSEPANRDDAHHWRRAYPYPNGDVLVIFGGLGILKLDRESNVLWKLDTAAHHAAHILPNGDIYTLTRKAHLLPALHKDRPVLEDFVLLLDADGNPKQEWSVLEAFENSRFARHWRRWNQGKTFGDVFHTNAIEILDGRVQEHAKEFQAGRVLISMRSFSALAVIDLEERRVVWAHRGEFAAQHDPRVLPDGKLMLFDNSGTTGASAVTILDPADDFEPGWSYRGTEEAPFYSEYCGTAAPLPNGNVLITETDRGRAFEVTREQEIVWEFLNPERAGENGEFIAALFEVTRLAPDFPDDWLPRR